MRKVVFALVLAFALLATQASAKTAIISEKSLTEITYNETLKAWVYSDYSTTFMRDGLSFGTAKWVVKDAQGVTLIPTSISPSQYFSTVAKQGECIAYDKVQINSTAEECVKTKLQKAANGTDETVCTEFSNVTKTSFKPACTDYDDVTVLNINQTVVFAEGTMTTTSIANSFNSKSDVTFTPNDGRNYSLAWLVDGIPFKQKDLLKLPSLHYPTFSVDWSALAPYVHDAKFIGGSMLEVLLKPATGVQTYDPLMGGSGLEDKLERFYNGTSGSNSAVHDETNTVEGTASASSVGVNGITIGATAVTGYFNVSAADGDVYWGDGLINKSFVLTYNASQGQTYGTDPGIFAVRQDNSNFLVISTDTDGDIQIWMNGNCGSNNNRTTATGYQIDTGTPMTIGGVFDEANARVTLYINGSAVSSVNAFSAAGCSATQTRVGVFYGFDSVKGSYKLIAIWNRSLSASEMSDIYNNGAPLGWPLNSSAYVNKAVNVSIPQITTAQPFFGFTNFTGNSSIVDDEVYGGLRFTYILQRWGLGEYRQNQTFNVSNSTQMFANFTFAHAHFDNITLQVNASDNGGGNSIAINTSTFNVLNSNISIAIKVNATTYNISNNITINATLTDSDLDNATCRLYVDNSANVTIAQANQSATPIGFTLRLAKPGSYDYFIGCTELNHSGLGHQDVVQFNTSIFLLNYSVNSPPVTTTPIIQEQVDMLSDVPFYTFTNFTANVTVNDDADATLNTTFTWVVTGFNGTVQNVTQNFLVASGANFRVNLSTRWSHFDNVTVNVSAKDFELTGAVLTSGIAPILNSNISVSGSSNATTIVKNGNFSVNITAVDSDNDNASCILYVNGVANASGNVSALYGNLTLNTSIAQAMNATVQVNCTEVGHHGLNHTKENLTATNFSLIVDLQPPRSENMTLLSGLALTSNQIQQARLYGFDDVGLDRIIAELTIPGGSKANFTAAKLSTTVVGVRNVTVFGEMNTSALSVVGGYTIGFYLIDDAGNVVTSPIVGNFTVTGGGGPGDGGGGGGGGAATTPPANASANASAVAVGVPVVINPQGTSDLIIPVTPFTPSNLVESIITFSFLPGLWTRNAAGALNGISIVAILVYAALIFVANRLLRRKPSQATGAQ